MARDGDRGSATLELAVIAPAIFALFGLVVAAGRVETARAAAVAAAQDGVRAASLARLPALARVDGHSAAGADLAGNGCRSWSVSIEGQLQPGGLLTARVSCTAGLGVLPGSFTTSARASAAVDPYRGVGR